MRRASVQKSIFDSTLTRSFIIHSIIVCLICILAIVGKYMMHIGGILGDSLQFIVKVYKFPAYYLVDFFGGKVTGMRLFFYLMVDMAILSAITFFIRILINGKLKEEIESYRDDD